jgi:YggT family protein
MAQIVVQFFDLLFTVLYIAILARAILSWVQIDPYHPVVAVLDQITEPFLAPLRRIVPPIGMMDITPLVAIILIQVLQRIIHAVFAASL